MTHRCLEAAGVHLHGLCLRVVVLVLLAHHFPDAALVSRHGMALSVRASVLSLPLVICTFCPFELLPLRVIWCWVLVFATVWLTWCPTGSSVCFFGEHRFLHCARVANNSRLCQVAAFALRLYCFEAAVAFPLPARSAADILPCHALRPSVGPLVFRSQAGLVLAFYG